MNFPWISHDFPIVPTILSHVTSPFVGATACLLQYRSQRHFAAGTEPNRTGSLVDPNEATPSKTTFFLLNITKTQRWFWWFCQRKWIVLDGFGMFLFRKNNRNYEAFQFGGDLYISFLQHRFLASKNRWFPKISRPQKLRSVRQHCCPSKIPLEVKCLRSHGLPHPNREMSWLAPGYPASLNSSGCVSYVQITRNLTMLPKRAKVQGNGWEALCFGCLVGSLWDHLLSFLPRQGPLWRDAYSQIQGPTTGIPSS